MMAPNLSTEEVPVPLTYRQDVVTQVMKCVRAGESCALIGVSSSGKSNLLRFLTRPDVQRHHLGEEADRFLFLYIDGNSLSEMSEWGVYELCLHRLLQAIDAQRPEMSSPAPHPWEGLVLQMESFYQRAVRSQNRLLGQLYLERCAYTVCEKLGLRLVFLFDEFDGLLAKLDQHFFLNLRALRDNH